MLSAEKPAFFSSGQLEEIHKAPIPQHIAIIMDGNRRWARKHSLSQVKNVLDGHWAGARVLEEIVAAAAQLGIKTLTVYCFSTENRQRPRYEVEGLFHLFETYLKENRQKMVEFGIKFEAIGELSTLPEPLQEAILQTRLATKRGESIELVCAFNYGSRDEICRATQKIVQDCMEGKIEKTSISEKLFAKYLDTSPWKDPDLLIRTSNEMRISNFLLWQLAYTEFYITETFWPDFTPQEFFKAIQFYQSREKRLGK